MAEQKIQSTRASVTQFVAALEDPQQRADCQTLIRMLKKLTGQSPKMWGAQLVGFGSYSYRSKSGREGEWFLAGFSPRKKELSIFVMAGLDRYQRTWLKKLGKHRVGKSCLYVKQLADIDQDALIEILTDSYRRSAGSEVLKKKQIQLRNANKKVRPSGRTLFGLA